MSMSLLWNTQHISRARYRFCPWLRTANLSASVMVSVAVGAFPHACRNSFSMFNEGKRAVTVPIA